MNRKLIRQYEMLVRVRDFGAERPQQFPEDSLGGQAFARVAVAVAELREHATSEMSARPQRGVRPTPRQALLDALEGIGRTARRIKTEDPGFHNPFHLPRYRPSQVLLAAGRSFAREAEPVAARFVAHAMAPTFIADLHALIDRLEAALSARDSLKDTRIEARVHFDTVLASGLDAVRSLDVIVPNRLKDEPAALAVWARDRRVDFRRRKAEVTPPTPPPAISTPEDDPVLPVTADPAVPDADAA